MKKAIKNECYSKNDSPKNRNSTELHHDCHCERVKRVWQSISTCHAEFISASLDNFYGLLRHFVPRNDCKRAAFTLAEVLITLTIIGVIAALTIPNLMQKWSDHADVAKVKEAYSILSNAVRMAVAENGSILEWGFPEPNSNNSNQSKENSEYFADILIKYLKVKQYCQNSTPCFDRAGGKYYIRGILGEYESRLNFAYYGYPAFILDNGMRVVVPIRGQLRNEADMEWDSALGIDINGTKGPNKCGYDFFYFGITKDGLSPKGAYSGKDKNNCNPTVRKPNYNCSCQYWVLRKGNMDYKYRDVSAEW